MLARRILELDFHEIERWFDKREMKYPTRAIFPQVGFIVDNIACGFLYFTDSSVAFIDGYVSNPESDKYERGEALDMITNELIKMAIFHKCKMIIGDSKIDQIKHRALKHGFKDSGKHHSFYLEI